MESTRGGQKAGERTEHAFAEHQAFLILHFLEILEINLAVWEFFKLSLTCQLSIRFLHVVHYVFVFG